MNNRYFTIKNMFFGLFAALMLLTACEKEEELTGPDRLFRPVIKGLMESQGNWISATWQKNKGAVAYKVEISRDTFKTIDFSLQVDTNAVVFEDLEWDQLYQIQVQALAEEASKNSGMAFLGEMKTMKFPTILTAPTANDVTDVAAMVRWTNSGERATSLKVVKADDQSVVKEVELTAQDVENQYKRVTGLTGSTQYIIYAYSGETLRGWEKYTTKAPLVFARGSNIVDLSGTTDNPEILQETIQGGLPAGSVIILERGVTYTISSALPLNGALTIVSGLGFEPIAKIVMSNNFDIAAGSTIDSVKFRDVYLRGTDFGGKYVMNPNVGGAATVGKILFEACTIKNFRGIARFRSTGSLDISNLTFNRCLVDSIGNYGIVTVDSDQSRVNNIVLKNSTFSRTEVGIVSKSSSNSVTIENSTFYKVLRGGRYLVFYSNSSSDNIINGVKVHNSILGPGWPNVGETTAAINGVRANSNTNVDGMGTYYSADYDATASTYQIPNTISYGRESTYLFNAPESLDFTIKDLTFAGRNNAGDPRWRP